MVEMAIVMPILVLLIMALLDYAWLFVRSYQLTHTARHGVRLAVTPDATDSEVTAAIEDMLEGYGLDWDQATVEPADLAGAMEVEPGEAVSIEISFAYDDVKLIGFVPGPDTLIGRATMAKEGP